MRFLVLGPLRVERDDGHEIEVSSGRRRRLLAALIAHAGEIVPASQLERAVWGPDLPPSARATLHSHVSRLRRALSVKPRDRERVVTSGGGYVLRLDDADAIDAVEFEELVGRTAARLEDDLPQQALKSATRALSLWRGRAYGELADLEFFQAEAQRLEELRQVAVERRFEVLLTLGRHAEVVGALEAVAAAQPLRDRPVVLLMRALAGVGRQADALAAFAEHRRRLRDELGLDPSPGLAELHERILRHGHDVTARLRPSISTPVAAPHGVPLTVAPVFGRDDDVAGIAAILHDGARLVTLVGPGGVGKTRLAIEVAHRLHAPTSEATLVELAGVRQASAVVYAVAEATGVVPTAGTSVTRALVAGLAGRELLLVVDNCEHLTEEVTGLLDRLLRSCPRLVIVATSRQPLGVSGERVWRVAPLETAAAVQLFEDRAVAADARRGLTTERTQVERLVERLDGLPLAIELAAARTPAVPVDELLQRLDPRLRVLTGADGHRSVEAVLDWSRELLTDQQASVFDRLAVFAGPFTLDAAVRVCQDVGDPAAVAGTVADLVERSLVERHGARYRLLETVRGYAASRLTERGLHEETRVRHATCFADRAERASAGLRGTDEARWVEQVRRDLDDLRLAHQTALALDLPGHAVRLVCSLWPYAQWRAADEIFRWADATTSMASAVDQELFPVVIAVAALGATNRGQLDRADRLARQALDRLADPDDARRILPLHVRALVALYRGDREICLSSEEQVERLARRRGDHYQAIDAVTTPAAAVLYAGDRHAGLQRARVAVDQARELGNPTQLALALHVLADALAASDPQAALAALDEAITLARDVNARLIEGIALVSTATITADTGTEADALGAFANVLGHWQRTGDRTHLWITLRNTIPLLIRVGQHDLATSILAAHDHSPNAPTAYGTDAQRLATARQQLREHLGRRFTAAADRAGRLEEDELVDHFIETAVGRKPTTR